MANLQQKFNKKLAVILPAILLFLVILTVGLSIEKYFREQYRLQTNIDIQNSLAVIRSEIEAEANLNLFVVHTIAAYVKLHPSLNNTNFTELAEELISDRPLIDYIDAVPNLNTKARYQYPTSEGYSDFIFKNQQSAGIDEQHKIFIEGPVSLKNKQYLIVREYIKSHQDEAYGIVSAALNLDDFFQTVESLAKEHELKLAITQPMFDADLLIYGDNSIISGSHAAPVKLIDGEWLLHVKTLKELSAPIEQQIIGIRSVTILIALVMSILLYLYRLDHIAKLKMSSSLERREIELDTIIHNIPSLLFLKSAKTGKFVMINKAAEALLRIDREELIGKDYRDIFPISHAETYEHLENKVWSSGTVMEIKEEPIGFNEDRIYVHSWRVPIYDENNRPSFILVVAKDITEERRSREQKFQLESELAQANKMDALGKLTGGIAHDYNNMLGVIMGYVELLELDTDKGSKAYRHITAIKDAAERNRKLTEKLLAFSSFQTGQAMNLSINEVLTSMQELIQSTLTPVHEFELSLSPQELICEIVEGDFRDALLNLTLNAKHAMTKPGVFRIESESKFIDSEMAKFLGVETGYYAQITISDQGEGIEKHVVDKIFDPFFTTKGEQGSGLGLSQLYGFLERSDGTVRVYSELNIGTQFCLYIPQKLGASASTKPMEDKLQQQLPDGAGRIILVVDDEMALRQLGRTILESCNFNVVSAADGVEALEILAVQPVDCMVTDILMPIMSGYQLYGKVKELYPELPVIFTSGFADEQHQYPNITLLMKPYSKFELIGQIAKELKLN